MTPQIVSLVITGLAALIILFHILIGAIRGLKKSTFRLIWVFVWGAVCVLAATIIAKATVNIDVSFLHLTVNGEEISTLPLYVEKTLESSNPDVANMIADNPKILELCTSIASMFISLVLFEVLFWVTKLLLWPIWAILSHILFGQKKTKDTKTDIVRKLPKQNKHKGYGALVGLGLGLIVCMFTFVPLHFVNKQVMAIETETATEQPDGTQKGVLSEMLGENAAYLTVYEDSYIAKAFKYTGIGIAQDVMSDLLTSAKFEGEKIVLSKEVANLTPIYRDYKKVMEYDFQNLSQADIAELLPILDDAQSRILSSNMVKSLYNELAPYLAKNIVMDPDYFIQIPSFANEFVNNTIKDVIKAFFGIDKVTGEIDETKLIKMEDISADVSKIIDIAELVNETKLVEYMLNNEITFDKVKAQITTQLGSDIVDKLFEMRTISTILDVVIEPSIEYGIGQIPSFEYESETVSINYVAIEGGVQLDNVKNFLKSFATNVIQVVKNVDVDSKLYVSGDSLANAGAVIDALKNGQLISEATYNSAFNYGVKYAKKYLDEQFPNVDPSTPPDPDYENMYNVIGNMLVDSVEDINSNSTFAAEFGKLEDVFDFVSTLMESGDIETEIVKQENVVELGSKLDELVANNSLIFTKENCNSALKLMLDEFDMGDYNDYKETIKNNIDNIESYEDELNYAFSLKNATINNIDELETYLATLTDENGHSKSELITDSLIFDVAKDLVPTVRVLNVDITNNIKAQLEADKTNPAASPLEMIQQVNALQSLTIDTDKTFEEIDSAYLVALGAQLDALSDDYNLVINQTAEDKIGYKVTEIINDKVQEHPELGTKCADVQAICDDKTDKTVYPTFTALFTAIAGVLFD